MNSDNVLEILDNICKTSRSEAVQTLWTSTREAPTRFANNQISYGAETEQMVISFTAYQGKRQGTARVNSLEPTLLKDAVQRADLAARSAPELETVIKPLGPHQMPAGCSEKANEEDYLPEARGKIVEFACKAGRKEKVECSGFVTVTTKSRTIVNSAGLKASTERSVISCTLTARTTDGKGSGWSGAWAPHFADIDYRL